MNRFDYICRTCMCDLREAVAFNVNDCLIDDENGQQNVEMLTVCNVLCKYACIMINMDDSLPKSICQQCMSNLSRVYKFISKCQNTEQILQNTLTVAKPEEVYIPIDIKKERDTSDTETPVIPKLEEPDTENESSIINEEYNVIVAEGDENTCKIEVEESNLEEKRGEIRTAEQQLTQGLIDHDYCTKEKFACKICGKTFPAISNLKVHERRNHNGEKIHKCTFCEKTFKWKHNLKNHEKGHGDYQPYMCKICKVIFNNNDELITHETIHAGERLYKCRTCKKAFMKIETLIRHERGHGKPYVCKFCKKCFSRKGTLVVHERIHTGEKPYKCNICDKAYSCTNDLTRHASNHDVVKPYMCKFCDKSFNRGSTLIVHERIHTGEKPFVCKFCKKSFSTKGYLTAHERTHTGERPYVCKICGKSFGTGSNLNTHTKIHNGEKPYKCNICEKSFYFINVLKKHMTKSHNNG